MNTRCLLICLQRRVHGLEPLPDGATVAGMERKRLRSIFQWQALLLLIVISLPGLANLKAADELSSPVDQAITKIKAVGPEGQGNETAAEAWETLTTTANIDDLGTVIAALDGASPLAANWLRSAAQVIIENHKSTDTALPMAELGGLLFDRSHNAAVRVMAFEILEQAAPENTRPLIAGMLTDPAHDLRYRAVQQLIEQAGDLQSENPGAANLLYRQALSGAIDPTQVETIAAALTTHGDPVDLPRHFGFFTHWHVLAPFDNTDRAGFEAVFPPEEKPIDLEDRFTGKGDSGEITWQPFATTDPYGKVDLNIPYGPLKGVTGYAYTEFESEAGGPAELRLSCKNGWKIWFNGEFVFGRDEYHRGQRIDQYKMPVQVKPGKNTVLVKLCQDEQDKDWTVEWEFKLRLCDSSGIAILAADRPPTPVKKASSSRRGAGAKDTRN